MRSIIGAANYRVESQNLEYYTCSLYSFTFYDLITSII